MGRRKWCKIFYLKRRKIGKVWIFLSFDLEEHTIALCSNMYPLNHVKLTTWNRIISRDEMIFSSKTKAQNINLVHGKRRALENRQSNFNRAFFSCSWVENCWNNPKRNIVQRAKINWLLFICFGNLCLLAAQKFCGAPFENFKCFISPDDSSPALTL